MMQRDASGLPDFNRKDWAIRLGVALGASLLIALLGPFSTYERFSFGERFAYWGGLVLVLLLPSYAIRRALLARQHPRRVREDAVVAAILGCVLGPTVWVFNAFVMQFEVRTPLMFAEHVLIAVLFCLVPVVVRYFALNPDPGDMGAELEPVLPAFLRRLAPEMRGQIQRISADGHQLQVYTDQGLARVRMRFGDAMEEMTGFDGARIHRSHWVAFNAIEDVSVDGRKFNARLRCGSVLPVSQTGAEALRLAGLLRD